MKLPQSPVIVTNWDEIEPVSHPGETSSAEWRTRNVRDMRLRRVDYLPGYMADHWCDRGHVIFVLSGTLIVELKDGREFPLHPGMSWHVSDHGDAAHRTRTASGASVFIVD